MPKISFIWRAERERKEKGAGERGREWWWPEEQQEDWDEEEENKYMYFWI